jgi:hypothetical protein
MIEEAFDDFRTVETQCPECGYRIDSATGGSEAACRRYFSLHELRGHRDWFKTLRK